MELSAVIRRAALVLVVVLAACSSSPVPPSLKSAVVDYTRAFGDGDGRAAWALLSAQCKSTTTETDYRAIVAAAGVKYPGLHVTSYREELADTQAVVAYSTNARALSYEQQRWVLERNGWRYDGC